jgi:hypothetical protein
MDDGDRRRFLLATTAAFVKPAPHRGKGSQVSERVKLVALENHPGLAEKLPGRKNPGMQPFEW